MIGIGVAAPGAKLDINGTANGNVVLSAQGTAGQTADFFEIQTSAGADLITVSANAGALGGVVINEQGSDADIRFEGDTDANLFYSDASADMIGIGVAAPGAKLDINGTANGNVVLSAQGTAGQTADFFEVQNSAGADLITVSANAGALGGVVINEQGSDADIRFEGDTDANLFYSDASADMIGIGVAAPGAKLDINGTANGNVVLSAQGTAGQTADFFEVQNSAGADLITVSASAGALGGIIFNEQGSDADIRFEGDTDANLFYTDAGNDRVGIGTNAPGYKLDVRGTIIGGLPCVDVAVAPYDYGAGNDDEHAAIIAVGIPSNNKVYVKVTTSAQTSATNLDVAGSYSGWTDLNAPVALVAGTGPYIMDVGVTITKTDDDNDQFTAIVVARFSDGSVYVISTSNDDKSVANLANAGGGHWGAWTATSTNPGM